MTHWNTMPVKDRVQRFPTTRWSIVAAVQGPHTQEIEQTVSGAEQVEEEVRYLFRVLQR